MGIFLAIVIIAMLLIGMRAFVTAQLGALLSHLQILEAEDSVLTTKLRYAEERRVKAEREDSMIRERVNTLQTIMLDMKTELATLKEEERLHKAPLDESAQDDQRASTGVEKTVPLT